ncbi:hypothetical protein BZA05DRAFT_257963 [Tricharina praecox]|uniref:uncharacterized protein n=1 Tax=Tricharina praecox TaxID=43433 RepID=UPI00221F6ABD|nr:uncharacterized protein BZA05DRAFT_257963 [Tricharina praecox]KAI5854105.1 hypothetical protein BZA05DRAFT_257963 [Tricharina praecox]
MAFAPSLPTLPSYPRHIAPSRSESPYGDSHIYSYAAPTHKKSRQGASTYRRSQPRYSAPLTPDASDTDDGLMAHSIYSDRDYRSSLVASSGGLGGSRKRGRADVDSASERGGDWREQEQDCDERRGAGGKRRIIDVVGGTLGGVLRGAWEMFRPRIPFYGSAPAPNPVPAPPVVVEERRWLGSWDHERGAAHWMGDDEADRGETATFAGGWAHQQHQQHQQQWPASPPSTAGSGYSGASMAGSVGNQQSYFEREREHEYTTTAAASSSYSSSTAPLETGMSAQWIMVSPSTSSTRSTRSASISSRRPRLVASKKRGLKPPTPRSPGSSSTQSPGKRHRKMGSGGSLGDDEIDDDMRRFNERLKAMIREGKEALGATVEVVYDEDDDIGMDGF